MTRRTRAGTAMSVMDIAAALGISHQRVVQLEKRGLEKLRAAGLSPWDLGRQAWEGLPALTPGCRRVGARRW